MGHSVTCTFQVNVNVNNGRQYLHGAMSVKEVKGILLSNIEYERHEGNRVINAEIWAQTARGRNYLHGFDYAVMDLNYKITFHNIEMTPQPGYEKRVNFQLV